MRYLKALLTFILLIFNSFINAGDSKDLNQIDRTEFKIYINSGISLSSFGSLIKRFNLHNSVGFHIVPEIQFKLENPFYYGLELRIDYVPTKVGFSDQEDLEDYNDEEYNWMFPYSIKENAKSFYKSIIIMPKFGISGNPPKGSLATNMFPNIMAFFEVRLGLGKVWYNIDRFVTGGRSNEVLNDEFDRDIIEGAMTDSELLHILDSEMVFSFGLKFGTVISNRIRVGLSLQMNTGLEYNRYYEGGWTSGYFQFWHDPQTRRMKMQNIMLEIGYQIK